MSPKYRSAPPAQLNRRMFLRGAGGAFLALPFLPSLLESSEAKAATTTFPKFFVHMRTPHGAVDTVDMWPSGTMTPDSTKYIYPIRKAALTSLATPSGSNTKLSTVLMAPSSVLTSALIAKMNVLQGLDIPTYMAHNNNGCLGNYDSNKQPPPASIARATIDQIMAYSPAFYPSLSSVRARSVAVGVNSGSVGYKTAGVPSSGVSSNQIGAVQSAQGLFDTLLGGTPASGPAQRARLVDQVLASYNRLRNGSRRLSTDDKTRLDQHISAVDELDRSLGTTLNSGCTPGTRPNPDNLSLTGQMAGNPTVNVEFFTMINQVIAVAMNCGATQIFTSSIDEDNQNCTFTTYAAQGESWHQNVAHEATAQTSSRQLIAQFNQTFFAGVYLDFVNRLNSFSDGAGGTLLDHALVCWGQECGAETHYAFSMPVITAGSAGNAIVTGNFCDYRNMNYQVDSASGSYPSLYTGIVYNQWLGTALQAMGVPKSAWATESNHPGYGARVTYADYGYGSQYEYFFTNHGFTDTQAYSDAMWQQTGNILPFLV